MDEELKRMVEAILFAAARKLELAEIASLCRRSESEISAVLEELKAQLEAVSSPTMLLQDGTAWKLTVREKYVGVIKKVVTKTELPKGHLETLAVVAYKAPVLQSKVVKIRTNKAYDHLAQLENSGFITREKSGRSKLLKLTPKFFEYFDIDPSKLKHKFVSSGDVEKAIEAKEKEIENTEVEQRKQTEERLGTPQIVLEDGKAPLETYPVVQPSDMLPTGVEIAEAKLGNLPVYDVPLESIPPEERPPVELEHPHHKHHKKKPHKKHPHTVHHPREHVEKPAEAPEIAAPEVEAPVEEVPAEVVAEAPAPEVPVAPEVSEAVPEAPVPAPVKVPKEKKPKKEKPAKEVPAEVEIPKVEEAKPEEVILTPEQKISKEAQEKAARMKGKAFEEGKGLYPKGVPPEMEAKIEQRIKRILSGEPEEEEKEE